MMASKSSSSDKDVSKEAFAVFDPEKKGYITGPGLKKVMLDLGEELNDADIDEMMSKVDLNGDGKIDFSGKFDDLFNDSVRLRVAYLKIVSDD